MRSRRVGHAQARDALQGVAQEAFIHFFFFSFVMMLFSFFFLLFSLCFFLFLCSFRGTCKTRRHIEELRLGEAVGRVALHSTANAGRRPLADGFDSTTAFRAPPRNASILRHYATTSRCCDSRPPIRGDCQDPKTTKRQLDLCGSQWYVPTPRRQTITMHIP